MHNEILKYKNIEYQIVKGDEGYFIKILPYEFLIRIPEPKPKANKFYFKFKKQKKSKRYYFNDFETAIKTSAELVLERDYEKIKSRIKFSKTKNKKEKIVKESIQEKIKKIDEEIKKIEKIFEEHKKENAVNVKLPKIEKHGKKWRFRVRINGKLKRFSFNTYEEAEKKAKEIMIEKMKKKGKLREVENVLIERKNKLTLKEAISLYAEEAQNKFGYERMKKELYSLGHFLRIFGEDFNLYEISVEHLQYYKSQRKKDKKLVGGYKYVNEPPENITINNELRLLRKVINFLIRIGKYPFPNIVQEFLKKEKLNEEKRPPFSLTDEQMKNLFKVLEEVDTTNYLNYERVVCLLFFFYSAIRHEEFLRLRWFNIIPEQSKIILFENQTKTKRNEVILIPFELMKFILNLPRSKEHPDLVFPHIQASDRKWRNFLKWWKDIMKKAGCTRIWKGKEEIFMPRDCRANKATHLIKQGLPLIVVKNLLRFKTIAPIEKQKNFSPNFIEHLKMYLYLKKENENEQKKMLKRIMTESSEMAKQSLRHKNLHTTDNFYIDHKEINKLEREKLKELEGSKPEENKGEEK
jgi:integrase